MFKMNIELKVLGSKKLRKLLEKNNFVGFIFNTITGQRTPLMKEINFFLEKDILIFEYYYNGESPPNQDIFKMLEEDKYSVIEYTFNRIK